MGTGSAPATAQSQGPAGGGDEDQSSRLIQLLAAVGTGLGVLGFVAFVGGVVLWTRARSVGLPADDAVAVVPNGLLLTIGANVLVPAVLLAFAATAVIVAIHEAFSLRRRSKHLSDARTARRLRDEAKRAAILAQASAQQLAEERSTMADAAPGAVPDDESLVLSALAEKAQADKREASMRDWDASEAEATLAVNSELTSKVARARMWVELVVAAAIIGIVPLLLSSGILGRIALGEKAILIALAAAGVAAAVMIYVLTGKLVWFGLVAFLAVGVLFCAATFYRTKEDPKVEPAAVLRKDRPPRAGFLVAQTADTIYLGTFKHGSGQQRLLVIPRADVTDLAVGPLLSFKDSERWALGLALDLCRQWIPAVDPPNASTAKAGEAVAARRVCHLIRRRKLAERLGHFPAPQT